MKKKNKTILMSVVSLLLVVTLGLGVFFIFFNKENITTLKSEPLKQEISGLFEKTYYVNKNQNDASPTNFNSDNDNASQLNNVV